MDIGQVTVNYPMEGAVYILRCSNNRYYIGSTGNLERRISEHEGGHVTSTKHLLPVELVFSQTYKTIQLARQIEYRLKKQKSRIIIEKIIQDGFIKQ